MKPVRVWTHVYKGELCRYAEASKENLEPVINKKPLRVVMMTEGKYRRLIKRRKSK